MAAKYFYVPYTATDGIDYSHEHGMIVRAAELKKLLRAIDMEAKEGSAPPEIVSWHLQYGDPRPHPSLESAIDDARSNNVDAPHLYRLDARGGLQAISIGEKARETKGGREQNTHDPVASTKAMITTMYHAVAAIEDAHGAKRNNDRRAALGTAQWEIGQAWTHGDYSSLSEQDKADTRTYLYELGMWVHEQIADDKRPTAAEVKTTIKNADKLADFVEKSRHAANPRGTPR